MTSYIVAFDVLQAIGLVAAYVVLMTPLLAANIKRSATWMIFMGELVVLCASYLLLLGQQTGKAPYFGICLTQAALIFSAPVMCAFSALAITIELYLKLAFVDGSPRNITLTLISVPIVILIAIIIEIVAVWSPLHFSALKSNEEQMGLSNRSSVIRNKSGIVCTLSNTISWKISSALVIVAVFAMLVFEIIIISIFLRRRKAANKLLRGDTSVHLSTIIRVTSFSFLPITTLVITVIITSGLTEWTPKITSIVFIGVACVPLCASVIFGFQHDIIQAWIFWRKSPNGLSRYEPVSESPEFVETRSLAR
ncbi:hypothetical protein C8J56DRAFT_1048058 [Mycena floridula]|nr:hypothetical protein C8J56DRAFT_1048058 [Mycena floridula]